MLRKYILAALVLCVVTAKCLAAPTPIVYYTFDELGDVVEDASGNGNDGTPMGGVAFQEGGKFGGCFEFDGQTAYVDLGRVVQDDFTLMAWIKTDQPGVQLGAQGYQGSGLIWSDVAGVANDFILAVLGTKLSFFCGNPDLSANSAQDVVTGDWVHVAGVRSATDQKVSIYINGTQENTIDHANGGPLNAQPRIHVGGNTLDSRYYAGLVDEVKMFDVALTEGDIQGAMGGASVDAEEKLSATWGMMKVGY